MSDLIERGDAIKALYKYNFVTKEVIEREIMSIPSADRPQGEWKPKHNGYWTCSECGLSFLFYAKGNFCPNCGARMKGADDV